jgi:hypothetical protein
MEALCARGRSWGVVHAARAYLAGVGTTGSLLTAAALVFIVASALVAFHGWPHVAVQQSPSEVVISPRSASTGAISAPAPAPSPSPVQRVQQTVGQVTNTLGTVVSGTGSQLGSTVQQTTNTLGGAVGGVSAAAGGVVQSAGSGAAQTVNGVTQGLGGVLSGLGD